MIRLDRFLSEQGNISRSEAKAAIRSRSVTVNGRVSLSGELKINEDQDEVLLYGKHILYRKYMYIMLNKPAGVVCATRDGLSKTVLELLPEELRRKSLFPAGRLDKDTEGFVFITDDGLLAHKMLAPKSHVEKEYIVTLEKPAEDFYVSAFKKGLTIDGGELCLPAQIYMTEIPYVVRLVLTEGKYHQVKRMMEAVGNKVTKLQRIRIGGIILDENLAPGECREILHKEIASLYAKYT